MSYADPMIKEDWEGTTKRIALKIINMWVYFFRLSKEKIQISVLEQQEIKKFFWMKQEWLNPVPSTL